MTTPSPNALATRRYKLAHPDRVREKERKWRRTHKEKLRAKRRRYYLKHRQHVLDYARGWKQRNPGRWKELILRWKARNPDRVRELGLAGMERYRARKVSNGPADHISLKDLFHREDGICYICGKRHEFRPKVGRRSWEIEHLLPLSRGGTHTWANVRIACHECNLLKRHHTPAEIGVRTW